MISIILATYKPQHYIKESIESLYRQTLPFDKYEVLLILNGCNEPYYSQLQQIINQYSTDFNIRILQTDQGGLANARNIGLEHIKGDMVCFFDDDDVLSSSYLEEFESSKDKNHIIVSNVKNFISDINNSSEDYLGKAFEDLKQEKTFNIFKFRRLLSSACCKAIPVSLIQSDRFIKEHMVGEDAYFMAKLSCKIEKINFTSDKAIYFRRLTPNSLTRKKKKISLKLRHWSRLINDFCKLYILFFPKYNFRFILSRIIASCIQIIKK